MKGKPRKTYTLIVQALERETYFTTLFYHRGASISAEFDQRVEPLRRHINRAGAKIAQKFSPRGCRARTERIVCVLAAVTYGDGTFNELACGFLFQTRAVFLECLYAYVKFEIHTEEKLHL